MDIRNTQKEQFDGTRNNGTATAFRRSGRPRDREGNRQASVRYVSLGGDRIDGGLSGTAGDRKKHASVFVGQWAPTLLIFGLYNKLVKQLGSDRTENAL